MFRRKNGIHCSHVTPSTQALFMSRQSRRLTALLNVDGARSKHTLMYTYTHTAAKVIFMLRTGHIKLSPQNPFSTAFLRSAQYDQCLFIQDCQKSDSRRDQDVMGVRELYAG